MDNAQHEHGSELEQLREGESEQMQIRREKDLRFRSDAVWSEI